MIDLILLVLLVAYGVSGYRQGFIVSTLSLGGFVGGAVLAMETVPLLVQAMAEGLNRSLVVLGSVVALAWLGQFVGAYLGARVLERVGFQSVRVVDHVLGLLSGLVAVSLVAWFVGGALRASPSTEIARAVSTSKVLGGINAVVPDQLSGVAEGFREAVAGTGFPRVFEGIGPEQILPVEAPDAEAMDAETLARAKRSIVKITGNAWSCDRGQEGSGAVVATGRVVTNAHVVAGVRTPMVQVAGKGKQYKATVVLFDAQRDVAVLAVKGLTAPALTLGDDLSRADDAVVAGFPENGPFTAGAARVRSVLNATGEDIYGDPGVTRRVYSLYATVQPGNSGGPLLATDGSLVGVVFAKSLDDDETGYALTLSEVQQDLAAGIAATTSVSTGECAVD